jgi:hypothetical protein
LTDSDVRSLPDTYPDEAHTNNHIMVSGIEASYAEKEHVHFHRFIFVISGIQTEG